MRKQAKAKALVQLGVRRVGVRRVVVPLVSRARVVISLSQI